MKRGGGRGGGGRGGGGRGGRGGRGGGGMRGGSKVVVEPHRHEGVFVAKGKEDALVTKNMVPGEAVYNEKRVSVQVHSAFTITGRISPSFLEEIYFTVISFFIVI